MPARSTIARPAQRRPRSAHTRTGASRTRSTASHTADASEYDDVATATFVRRTLCAHRLSSAPIDPRTGRAPTPPLQDLLPPLSSSNQVDLQLFALLAVIIKEAVQSWYSRITPDHEFIDQVIHVIAHCTRGLEQRLRTVDFEQLVLDDIPRLVEAHVSAFRGSVQVALSHGELGATQRGVYHSLQPHPALSPVPDEASLDSAKLQAENEAAWRQLLVQGVLALLLPPEDLNNPCLRVLVTEIFSEMIIGNAISTKICQAWFIWEAVLKMVGRPPGQDKDGAGTPSESEIQISKPRLESFGLVDTKPDPVEHKQSGVSSTVSDALIMIFAALSTCLGVLQSVYHILLVSSSYPPRVRTPYSKSPLRPVVCMPIWTTPFKLAGLHLRMPWIAGSIALMRAYLLSGPGQLAATNSRLDRFLAHVFQTRVLDPAQVPKALKIVREGLFPGNAMGAARTVPASEDVPQIKSDCAAALVQVLPRRVRDLYLGKDCSDEDAKGQMEDLLDIFGDEYMNKRLVFGILDLVVCRLFPELVETGVEELLKERIHSTS